MQSVKNKVRFSFSFIPQGAKVRSISEGEEEYLAINDYRLDKHSTVVVDVGNRLCEGIIDHHHLKDGFEWNGRRLVSASGLLYAFPSLLSNISPVAEEVTIVVHQGPDFDCFVSAYLAMHFIEHGEFPEHADLLVEYAEEIDSGRLGIHLEHRVTPYTLSLVFHKVIEEKLKRINAFSYDVLNAKVMEKGIHLVEYILARFKEMLPGEVGLESPVLLLEGHPFAEEEQEVEADYKRYCDDLEEPGKCEKRKLLLPHISVKGHTEEVDALFWNSQPTCSLDKLWARGDLNSPSGTGYVFTFIPRESLPIEENWFEFFKEKPEVVPKRNRAIIAVNGTSSVCLRDLGRHLELAERKKEALLFGDNAGKWRSRETKRYPDEWADSDNPWYDGRDKASQIVDAPSTVLSLLSIQEMKKIVLLYAQPRAKENFNKIAFPFSFKDTDMDTIIEELTSGSNPFRKNGDFNGRSSRKFRPYIQSYMYNHNSSLEHEYHLEYSAGNFETTLVRVGIKDNEIEYFKKHGKNMDNQGLAGISAIDLKIMDISIDLFKFGVGFVVFDLELMPIEQTEVPLESMLLVNNELCRGAKGRSFLLEMVSELISVHELDSCEDGLIFTEVIFDQSTFYGSLKSEMLFKLANNMKWNEPISGNPSDLMSYELEISPHELYGYSKNGGALILIDPVTDNMIEEERVYYQKRLQNAREEYRNYCWAIFLIVLHQRYSMMNFSKTLAEIALDLENNKIKQLRSTIIEFIVQGYFSQISNDEELMSHYKKWRDILETEKLHEEILEQVSTLEDYYKRDNEETFNSKFNKVSFAFVFISAITGFFGMNIPLITGDDSAIGNNFAVYISLAGVGGLTLFYYWLNKKK
ncbi:hypothetical protein [Mesobacillus selenatarsenatis]|uniref:Uncharacterized protein n=1 Tax=Mesobacillus selenatarsenatis (strain DSM 18680 / JCM 14380 / FERM P-15431 / SF-1) TaxID=1321606 RepID=A0A0A8WWL2_MESS1|nr:hypothetical protein [Mesobacillus selenatarsenatis]GAM12040.1 hypothetical protein SAMD00020551_0159 [Mesobacillus selenatarsenatis SF-1]